MSNKVFKRAFIGSGLGFVFGLIMTLPFFLNVEFSRNGKAVFETINAPALWLAHAWTYDADLPPSGEVAWIVVPVAAILVQWSLIGLLGGSRCYRKLQQKPTTPTSGNKNPNGHK
jgi:hypothetical protein